MPGQSGRVQQKIVHNSSAKQQDPEIPVQRHLESTSVVVQKVGIHLRIEQLIYILLINFRSALR